MKCALEFAAAVLVLLTLAGCASSGVIRNATPLSASQPVSLDFVLVETSSSRGDLESESSRLNNLVVTGLKEAGFFGSVSGNKSDVNPGPGIKISAEIKEIQKVSDNARLWMGALAGQARIVVQVTVTDLNSGNQIVAFEAEGKSGKSAAAGTTDEAIERAAEQVVAEMVEISSRISQ